MRMLILGGTVFLGRALVDAALEAGHSVTLFNRGKSNPELYPDVETVLGDRDGGLDALAERTFDAVLDTCGYVPRVVKQSAEFFAKRADHYTFISSLSVYADTSTSGLDESAAVGTIEDPTVEEVTGETYGPLKALCEREAEQAMPGRALIVRPGLIVGPHDPTDRFTYWPCRIARGGTALVPGQPERRIRCTDVRDLGRWCVAMAANKTAGVFNADGPAEGVVTMGDLIAACHAASDAPAELVWVEDAFLDEHEVGAWMEMPLWLPETNAEYAGFFAHDGSKAVAHGLTFRPLLETVRDTLAWASSRPADRKWRAGMDPEKESELLSAWKAASTQ